MRNLYEWLFLDLSSLDDKFYKLAFKRPNEPVERSKQKLIELLRSETFSREGYIELALAYFHELAQNNSGKEWCKQLVDKAFQVYFIYQIWLSIMKLRSDCVNLYREGGRHYKLQ
ncbi:MAG: hypothetical protein IBX55_15460 [Methyloprofundus sp.]|nr:hypothetical protein [Methyloprofundus sp.]